MGSLVERRKRKVREEEGDFWSIIGVTIIYQSKQNVRRGFILKLRDKIIFPFLSNKSMIRDRMPCQPFIFWLEEVVERISSLAVIYLG